MYQQPVCRIALRSFQVLMGRTRPGRTRLRTAARRMCEQRLAQAALPDGNHPNENEQTYLADAPEAFAKTCDVLLKLDDGSELPAHSQILARFSSVCASMLDGGPLSSASTLQKADVPLIDCSRATAISFLSLLYSTQQFEHMRKNVDSSMAIASLAHKLDIKVYPLHAMACLSL